MNDDEIKRARGAEEEKLAEQSKLLDEENLPDHLISPDSEVKKKRITNQYFRELNYLVNLEIERIYSNVAEYLRKLSLERLAQAEADEELLFKMNKDLNLLSSNQGVGNLASLQLTEEQLKKLDEINSKLSRFIDLLENKMKIIDGNILILDKKIKQIELKLSELKQQYVKLIEKNFYKELLSIKRKDKSFVFVIPKEMRITGAEREQFNIPFDDNVIKNALALFKARLQGPKGESISSGDYLSCLKQAYKDQMMLQLQHYPAAEREQIADGWLESPKVKKEIELRYNDFQSATCSMHELSDCANQIAKASAELNQYQLLRERNFNEKIAVAEQIKAAESLREMAENIGSSPHAQANIDDVLTGLDEKLDKLIESTNLDIESLLAFNDFAQGASVGASKTADELQSLLAQAEASADESTEQFMSDFTGMKEAVSTTGAQFDDSLTSQIQALLSGSKPQAPAEEEAVQAEDESDHHLKM